MFGKLGSSYSWQYDPLAKYRVTIGCELKLLMLIEEFILEGIEVVSVNTDGVVVHYPKSKQDVVDRIHKEWEEKTSFVLEDTHYNKLVFSSVNDYIAVIVDPETDKVDKVKYKGDFEIDKEPHKNNSQRIVPIALSEYFVKGTKISDVVGNIGYEFNNGGKNEVVTIYDYCIGRKQNSKSDYYLMENGEAVKLKDKVLRYFIANKGAKILKRFNSGNIKGRVANINAGFDVKMFMQYEPAPESGYDINTQYYLNECRKIIDSIESGTRILERGAYVQQSLF